MSNKICITGASRGIGQAIAAAFAREGWELYLICKENLKAMEEAAEVWRQAYGTDAACFAIDVADAAAYEAFLKELPAMDVLINNAGISFVGLLQDMELSDWRRVMDTNLTSVFLSCKYLLPGMLSRGGGRIINISSVWGEHGASMESAYSASKGAVNALTKALAKETATTNVQINAIACGLIDTSMNAHLSEKEIQSLIGEIPANRIGRPEEVAALCLQLASAPEYLTGQIITLDGGWTV
ncbi:MAG: SDR family NAD(P)-dependent oxidoreductase [Lachnospiraceae bacterium]|nr:SDR family NAD(P)-dependent oxidoreductase [Lachnospiraceae bacterium]